MVRASREAACEPRGRARACLLAFRAWSLNRSSSGLVTCLKHMLLSVGSHEGKWLPGYRYPIIMGHSTVQHYEDDGCVVCCFKCTHRAWLKRVTKVVDIACGAAAWDQHPLPPKKDPFEEISRIFQNHYYHRSQKSSVLLG